MPPLRLHGNPVSNYVNICRTALIEKGIDHELVVTGAAQDERFLAMNPMGKIPVLETPEGWLAETNAILEYLDDRYAEPSLRPDDLFLRARGRQIVNVAQSYVEAPVRGLFAGVFFGGSNSDETVRTTRAMLDRATGALARLLAPHPFLLGARIAQADVVVFYHLDIADRVTRFVYGRSLRDEIGTLAAWDAVMRARPSVELALAEFETYFAGYLKAKGAAYRADAPAAPDRLSHA